MLRPSRVIAVARSEAREHMSGRAALRLLGVAAALLLPASWFVAPSRLPLPSEMPVERTAVTNCWLKRRVA